MKPKKAKDDENEFVWVNGERRRLSTLSEFEKYFIESPFSISNMVTILKEVYGTPLKKKTKE